MLLIKGKKTWKLSNLDVQEKTKLQIATESN